MPKVSGIFDNFTDLDLIPLEDIMRWIHPAPNLFYLENFLPNRLAYPQTVPTSPEDMEIDLAILREALRRDSRFYDRRNKRILIQEEFIARFPNIKKLVWAFIDAYQLTDITQVTLVKKGYQEVLGTVVNPKFETESKGVLTLKVDDKSYQIKQGALMIIPSLNVHCHLQFSSTDSKLLGKNELAIEAFGGELGIVIDGRSNLK